MPGDPAGPWSWSPDGQLVVIKGRDGPQIAEVVTGRVISAAPAEDVAWVSDNRLLYRDVQANELVLADRDGRDLARQSLPRELGVNLVLTVSPD